MSPADLLDRHARLIASGDLDGLADLYADDARMLAPDGVAESREDIRARYETFLAYHGEVSSARPTLAQTTDAEAFSTLVLASARGRFRIVNAFVLDGERVARHFSAETDVTLDRDEVVGEG